MRLRVREVAIPGLPPELDGLRIAHLSDFHLGVPSRGVRALLKATDWVVERQPDLVCITGDLLSRPGGLPLLEDVLERLPHPYVVLGNHDLAHSRDPFSKPVELDGLPNGTLLLDESVRVGDVELGGVDPRSWLATQGSGFRESDAKLRILLCHFPYALVTVPPGRWHLILAGHLHAGQIVLPYGVGKLLLAHPTAPYAEGLYERDGTVMHVSPGLGTTFVPFLYFARPEATELVLRSR